MEKFRRRMRAHFAHPFGRHRSRRHCNVDRMSHGHRLFNLRLLPLRVAPEIDIVYF